MSLQGLSSCGRCLSPADTPSCRGRRCCPSSACWGPAGGGHGTISPRAKGYSLAPLLWQPFSTATGPLLHPVRGSKDGSAQPGCEITAGSERGEGTEQWRTWREVKANSMPATRILLWMGPAEATKVQPEWRQGVSVGHMKHVLSLQSQLQYWTLHYINWQFKSFTQAKTNT